jgi:hypothetical protein
VCCLIDNWMLVATHLHAPSLNENRKKLRGVF